MDNYTTNNPYAEYERNIKQENKKRNRKMLLIGLSVAAVIFIGITVFMLFIFQMMKNSDAYITAENYLTDNKEIIGATGGIKDFDMFPTGSISTYNDSGEAILTIGVNGKKHDIDVFVHLEKEPGTDWQVIEMQIFE
ncbi:MAG: hypothetical protein DI539_14030 [Flavobacterium psychrophilum]|nr:MAG: hypothetical protein DI539_14030 [Flavobacterium psychrophilum]